MHKPVLNFLSAISLSWLCLTSAAQTPYPVKEKTKLAIDSVYKAWVKKYEVAGVSIAIVDNGKVAYAAGYGFADKENKVPASEQTIYRIGSITKSFSALSIMQLQEKGRIDIRNSVKNYLPDLTIGTTFNDGNTFAIRDMMSHVSGMPCDVNNGDFCDSPPDIRWLIRQLNLETAMSPKRYKHAYSNVAYGLLGEVIARTSGLSYADYVQQHIFDPLGMKSSFVLFTPAFGAQYAKGYYHGKRLDEPMIRDQAAGLIHSNVLDMAKYLNLYLQDGRGIDISAASIREMQENQIPDITLPSNSSWGYGLYSHKVRIRHGADSSIENYTGHGGDTYAFHADMGFIRERGVGVILLTNSDNGRRIISSESLMKLYLRLEKGDTLLTDYKTKIDTLVPEAQGEQRVSGDAVKGAYNLGVLTFRVDDGNKVQMKQGPARITLASRKNDSLRYQAKATLFRLIPLPLTGQELAFVKIGSEVYMKSIFTDNHSTEYFAKRKAYIPLPDTWKKCMGKYTAVQPVYGCKTGPVSNLAGLSLTLEERNGYIYMTVKGKSRDTSKEQYLDVIDDTFCLSGGIGRGTGESMRILPNGNIHYSGFEFTRK